MLIKLHMYNVMYILYRAAVNLTYQEVNHCVHIMCIQYWVVVRVYYPILDPQYKKYTV